MKTSLKEVLVAEWGIRDFIFYVMTEDEARLKPYSLDFEVVVPEEINDKLFDNYLELDDPRCTHAAVVPAESFCKKPW